MSAGSGGALLTCVGRHRASVLGAVMLALLGLAQRKEPVEER